MTTTLLTFADTEIKMRWREPFLTAGLNAHAAVVRAPGVYRGFRLAGTGTNYEIQIVSDLDHDDHVAVYETTTGYAVTLRRTGSFTLDLTSYAAQSIYLALYVVYTIGSTTATIRAYTAAEFSTAPERAELVVLGLVTVPGSALPITTLAYDYRVVAARRAAPGASAPVSLVRNGGFEAGVVGDAAYYAAYFWEKETTAGTGSWKITTAHATGGSLKSLGLDYSAGPMDAEIRQPINVPVKPGQLVRLAYKLRVDAPTTAGSVVLVFNFIDNTGTVAGTATYGLATGSGTGFAFIAYEAAIVVPANMTHLRSTSVVASGVTFGSTGVALYLDDVQLQLLETASDFEAPVDSTLGHIEAFSALILEDPTAAPYSAGSVLRHVVNADSGDPGIIVSDKARAANVLNLLGRMVLGGGLDASPLVARARVPVSAGNAYTLIWQMSGGMTGSVRFYAAGSGGLLCTVNAYYNGEGWTRDVSGGSYQVLLLPSEWGIYEHQSGLGDSWDDTYSPSHWARLLYVPSVSVGSPANLVGPFTVTGNFVATALASIGSTLTASSSRTNNDAGAIQPNIVANRALTPVRSVIVEMNSLAGVAVRLYRSYASSDEFFEVVVNAVWDSASGTWTKDTGSTNAVKYAFGPNGLSIYRQSAGGSWNDATWGLASLRVSTTASPTPTFAPAVNSLHVTQVARAWAVIVTDGTGGAAIVDGFNIATVAVLAGSLTIVFATPMADGNYHVAPSVRTPVATDWYGANPIGVSNTGFALAVSKWTGSAVAQVDLGTVARTITFSVNGQQ